MEVVSGTSSLKTSWANRPTIAVTISDVQRGCEKKTKRLEKKVEMKKTTTTHTHTHTHPTTTTTTQTHTHKVRLGVGGGRSYC